LLLCMNCTPLTTEIPKGVMFLFCVHSSFFMTENRSNVANLLWGFHVFHGQ
jgi:hypothetical protein